jgi:exodeoxyribonuclease VII small subunit
MTQKKLDYQTLSNELDSILVALQQGELDVDVATKQYERGLELIKLLETYLKDAENTVTKLKAQFGEASD